MERCNCKNQARLVAIVRGNDFTLEAHASVYDQDKEIYVPFDLSEATDVTISAVGRYTKAEGIAVAVAGNKVTARFSGALAEGLYGVEILFRDTAGRGRIFERDLFAIVGDSSEATAGAVSEGGSGDGLDISVDVRSRVVRIGRTAMVSDYRALSNKPTIGGVELDGDKTAAELGLAAAGDLLPVIDLLEAKNEKLRKFLFQTLDSAIIEKLNYFFPQFSLEIEDFRPMIKDMPAVSRIMYGKFRCCVFVAVDSAFLIHPESYFDQTYPILASLAVEYKENLGKAMAVATYKMGQVDWAQADSQSLRYIVNKPTKLSQFTDDKGYATKTDLNNKQDRPVIVDISANSVEVNCTELSGKLYSGSGVTALAISASKTSGTKSGAEDVFQFSTGASPAITVTGVSWANSDVPTFEANKTYEIHIIYNATLDKFLTTYAVYE